MGAEPFIRSLVLVIDVDHENRRAVRRMFGSLGFDVVQASNALVGLELVQRLGRSFQLLLIDLDLPGMPGTVVIETLRLFRPQLPVLCTGRGKTVGVPATPEQCLGKPLQLDELREKVAAALAKPTHQWTPETADVALRARARYAEGENLIDAALELARGYQGE